VDFCVTLSLLIRRVLGTGTLQEADLVLGGDDGKDCTYAGGYLKRQAVFSCLTCVPDGVAGVCTACSLACHDGHEVTHLTPFPSKVVLLGLIGSLH
jgi:hypothetical protein